MKAIAPDPLPQFGPRVALRRLSPGDLASFQAYRHDPVVGRYQGWSPLPDAQAAAFLEEMSSAALFAAGEWAQIGIADRATNALIGDIGICVAPDGRSAEIGFSLRAESQGRGLAREALAAAIQLIFAHTAVAEVFGMADVQNESSIRLMERLGMQKGAITPDVLHDQPCLMITYSLARPAGSALAP